MFPFPYRCCKGLGFLEELRSPGCSGLFCVHTPPQIGLSGERAECCPFSEISLGPSGSRLFGEERMAYIEEFETPFHMQVLLAVQTGINACEKWA